MKFTSIIFTAFPVLFVTHYLEKDIYAIFKMANLCHLSPVHAYFIHGDFMQQLIHSQNRFYPYLVINKSALV